MKRTPMTRNFAKIAVKLQRLVTASSTQGNTTESLTCPCCQLLLSTSKLKQHFQTAHVNPLYWPAFSEQPANIRRCNSSRFLHKSSRFDLHRRFRPKNGVRKSSQVFLCHQCHFACNSVCVLQRHHSSKHARFETSATIKDKKGPKLPRDRTKLKRQQNSRASAADHYEEMAQLELNPNIEVIDYAESIKYNLRHHLLASEADLKALSDNAPVLMPRNVEKVYGSNVLCAESLPGDPSELYFYNIPLAKRRSGLHGLRRNTQATICNRCFQTFLNVVDFEYHSCCQSFLAEKIKDGSFQSDGIASSDLSGILDELAGIVVVRNESNLPPDLGNGYRRPLFIMDTKAIVDPPLQCTLCRSWHNSVDSLHRHIVECGRLHKRPAGTKGYKQRNSSPASSVITPSASTANLLHLQGALSSRSNSPSSSDGSGRLRKLSASTLAASAAKPRSDGQNAANHCGNVSCTKPQAVVASTTARPHQYNTRRSMSKVESQAQLQQAAKIDEASSDNSVNLQMADSLARMDDELDGGVSAAKRNAKTLSFSSTDGNSSPTASNASEKSVNL